MITLREVSQRAMCYKLQYGLCYHESRRLALISMFFSIKAVKRNLAIVGDHEIDFCYVGGNNIMGVALEPYYLYRSGEDEVILTTYRLKDIACHLN